MQMNGLASLSILLGALVCIQQQYNPGEPNEGASEVRHF
jgi:hypothetical protein